MKAEMRLFAKACPRNVPILIASMSDHKISNASCSLIGVERIGLLGYRMQVALSRSDLVMCQ
jgi:hypothetical protein